MSVILAIVIVELAALVPLSVAKCFFGVPGFVDLAMIGFLIVSVLAAFYGLTVAFTRREFGVAKFALVTSALLLLYVKLVPLANDRLYLETIARGNRIVSAINAFSADSGHYPHSLKHLHPSHFSEPALTEYWLMGPVPFRYRVVGDTTFVLNFQVTPWKRARNIAGVDSWAGVW